MNNFFEDTMQGLLEAIEIDKGNLPLKELKGMPGKTYYVADDDKELIDKIIEIRKKENVSQAELAEMTGNSQQAISRFEQKTHSSSMKLFSSIIKALGYEVQIVKKKESIVPLRKTPM